MHVYNFVNIKQIIIENEKEKKIKNKNYLKAFTSFTVFLNHENGYNRSRVVAEWFQGYLHSIRKHHVVAVTANGFI